MTTFSLHTIAPRLARARDQLIEHRAAQAHFEHWLIGERLRLQKLIAHRELQALRAGARNDRRYVKHRYQKLDRARAALAALETQAQERRAA